MGRGAEGRGGNKGGEKKKGGVRIVKARLGGASQKKVMSRNGKEETIRGTKKKKGKNKTKI